MPNSAEHGILNAYKYKIIRLQLLTCSHKPIMLFFQLINVKVPTIVGILTIISRKNFKTQNNGNPLASKSKSIMYYIMFSVVHGVSGSYLES